jgi:predicted  nucleic acid-binding Zn-ribbon protein
MSIDRAVREHIDLFGEMEKVQTKLGSLASDIERLAGTRTADRGAIERMERRLAVVEKQGTEILQRLDAQGPLLNELVEGLRRLRG